MLIKNQYSLEQTFKKIIIGSDFFSTFYTSYCIIVYFLIGILYIYH